MGVVMAKNAITINVQHDYITLRTPHGSFTRSRMGAKCSGQLAHLRGAVERLDAWVFHQAEVPGCDTGKAMRMLAEQFYDVLPEAKDLQPPVRFSMGQKVQFIHAAFIKKFPGEHVVVLARPTTVVLMLGGARTTIQNHELRLVD